MRIDVHFFTCGYPIVAAPFIENIIHLAQWVKYYPLLWHFCWKAIDHRYSGLYSIPLVYVPIFLLVPHCLGNCHFIIHLEIGSLSSLIFSKLFWLF